MSDQLEAHGEISKVDVEKRLVFGYAYVTHDKDGNVAVDKSGEFIDDYDELETMAYDFVLRSRQGGADHQRGEEGPVIKSTMVESMVFTPDKIAKMGIPPGILPSGWWTGWKVHDDEIWDSVKQGKRLAFSIHGSGIRKEVEDAE